MSIAAKSAYKEARWGDILCLMGAFLYAVSNVSQHLVQNHSRVEFLGCIGAGGAICGIFQLFIFGHSEMEEIASLNIINILLLIAFVALLFTMYSTTSFFLQYADAVLFNMSLLTSDVFGAILGYFFFSTRFSGLYLLSLAFIVGGVYFYGEGPQLRRCRFERERMSIKKSTMDWTMHREDR